MHLGFLTPEYPHSKTNPAAGIGSSIKNIAAALVENGVQVSVFIFGQKGNAVFMEAGIKFHLIEQQNFRLLGWYLHRKFLQNYLNKYIAVDKIDAVEAPDWMGITAFMNLRCPLVIHFHGSDTYFCKLENRPQKKKNYWFEKTALEGADHLLSVSQFTAEETGKLFKLNKDIHIIPNSIDVNLFKPENKETVPNSILFFGSIIRKKGVLELAHMFNHIHIRVPEVKLAMAGRDVVDITTGSSTLALFKEILTASAREQVIWKGNLPYPEIICELHKAKVVVLPSFAEALPMTWLEAMAMEKALVTSNIGWAKEVMVDGETGFTVDPKDHELYAARIIELLMNPDLTKKMGKAARERVLKKFSTEVVVERNIEFYERVIRRSSETQR